MASRGTYGSRSTKKSERDDERERAPPGLSRRLSVTAPSASTSKLPTHTSSWFSRGKLSRTGVDPSPPPSKPEAAPRNILRKPQKTSTEKISTRSVPPARAQTEPSYTQGSRNLAVGSSTSARDLGQEKRQLHMLRHKPSSIDQHSRYAHTEPSVSSEPAPLGPYRSAASTPGGHMNSASGSILGLAVPTVSTSTSSVPTARTSNYDQATSSSSMATYHYRYKPDTLSAHTLPPPTPSFANSSGSSTRRSESPGSFSRTSTPTSMSSYSPAISIPAKSPLSMRQLSPSRSRPPITGRRRAGGTPRQEDLAIQETRGLPALRESATSSSSSSTVKGVERTEGTKLGNSANLASPAPSGLPKRKSSHDTVPLRRGSLVSRQQGEYNVLAAEKLQSLIPASQSQENRPPRTDAASPHYQMRSPPSRPSREGTPKLEDLTQPSPIIQSNLSRLLTTGHKRRESLDRPYLKVEAKTETPNTGRATLGRSASNSSSLSVQPSGLPSSSTAKVRPSLPRPAQNPQPREFEPVDAGISTSRSIRDPGPLSTAPSKSSSRFGLFTKRTKSPLEATSAESAERAAKKGPTAGTGHEGYGKYARRGRSGSTSTSASRGRSTSTSHSSSVARTPTSRKSSFTSRDEPEMDGFLLDRIAPVVISGGGQTDNHRNDDADIHKTRSGDNSTGMWSDSGLDSSSTFPAARSLLQGQNLGTDSDFYASFHRDSQCSPDRDDCSTYSTGEQLQENVSLSERGPTLATRRSLHRSQLFREVEPLKIPAPIDTRVVAPSPGSDSRGTTQSSLTHTDDSTLSLAEFISEGHEGNWMRTRKPEKRAKSPRKWNFFQRAHATPKQAVVPDHYDEQDSVRELPVTISRLPQARPVAHYAMLDNSSQGDFDGMENQSQENMTTLEAPNSAPVPRRSEFEVRKQEHKQSMLLPSPPGFPAEFAHFSGQPPASVALRQTEVITEFAHLRGASSASAGLPQSEVAASEHPTSSTLPKPKTPRLQQVGRIPRVISKRDRLHNPPPQSFSRPFARTPLSDNEPLMSPNKQLDSGINDRPILGIQTERIPSHPWGEALSAKPASAPVASSKTPTLVAREEFLRFPNRPLRMGSDVSGSSSSGILSLATTAVVPKPSTAPSEDEVWKEYDELLDDVESRARLSKDLKGKAVRKEDSLRIPAPLHIRKESLVTGFAPSPPKTPLADSSRAIGPTRALPSPPRISNLLSPLQSAGLSSTTLSFSDFFAGYGDRNRGSAASRRQNSSCGTNSNSSSIRSSFENPPEKKRNTQIMAAKTSGGPGPQSNLRFSALMTSRWLSFGRVLFSPAHMEIQSNRQDRVLVLDGLGNDDWSFYCALTYPNATVYNLSSYQRTSTTSARKREVDTYGSPSNHRQIYHNSVSHPFPFPKGYFTAAVFRFPVACSEATYFNAISECKRVLRPGGHLEMSILDLDMVNMGNRARRAVRMLKVKMQVAEPEVSLKPVSDNIQKMLGRRGFENLNRCTVSVPVAGSVSDSRAGSFDERDLSLGDMLKDPSQQGDEGITKMVSKVGRWWYTRCYETSVLPYDDVERSIWTDKALLRECEKRETGFKLLICYAQKPLAPKRRTVSM